MICQANGTWRSNFTCKGEYLIPKILIIKSVARRVSLAITFDFSPKVLELSGDLRMVLGHSLKVC